MFQPMFPCKTAEYAKQGQSASLTSNVKTAVAHTLSKDIDEGWSQM